MPDYDVAICIWRLYVPLLSIKIRLRPWPHCVSASGGESQRSFLEEGRGRTTPPTRDLPTAATASQRSRVSHNPSAVDGAYRVGRGPRRRDPARRPGSGPRSGQVTAGRRVTAGGHLRAELTAAAATQRGPTRARERTPGPAAGRPPPLRILQRPIKARIETPRKHGPAGRPQEGPTFSGLPGRPVSMARLGRLLRPASSVRPGVTPRLDGASTDPCWKTNSHRHNSHHNSHKWPGADYCVCIGKTTLT